MNHLLLVAGLSLALSVLPAHSGEGHDHGDAGASSNANGPQRQPDGSVFLPKPAQRQLGVRTLVAVAAELPRTVELSGKVLMDPQRGRQGTGNRRRPHRTRPEGPAECGPGSSQG